MSDFQTAVGYGFRGFILSDEIVEDHRRSGLFGSRAIGVRNGVLRMGAVSCLVTDAGECSDADAIVRTKAVPDPLSSHVLGNACALERSFVCLVCDQRRYHSRLDNPDL